MKIDDLIDKVLSYNKNANIDLIKKAYAFAENAHNGVKRVSGDPYVTHPLGVAFILAGIKMDATTISAALLHDVLEDDNIIGKKITKQDLTNEFGDELASLVDGVTNVSRIRTDKGDAENLRKLLLSSSKDIRVIIIKLADVLHNMYTIKYLPKERQERFAKDALDIYAPIAYRLSIHTIKNQLEDLSFKTLNPDEYDKIQKNIEEKVAGGSKRIKIIKEILEKELNKNNIRAELYGRVKHAYSVYKKNINKYTDLDEIFDLVALRVIVEDVSLCYEVLGIIHNLWKPVPGRLKDYIATPKDNGYQSLHTVVIVENKPIEFQIRTHEMHDIAEYGIASHYTYKGHKEDAFVDKKLKWLKQLLDLSDKQEFKTALKVDFFDDEIYAFTPKDDLIRLPKGGTILDFAYAIHSKLGDHCTGANINGKFASLRETINNGDVVEILTNKKQKPSRDWLKVVKTSKAREKVRQAIRSEGAIPVTGSLPKSENKEKELEERLIEAPANFEVRLALCCKPLPNDKIVGIVKGKTISIHKNDCDNLKKNVGKRIDVKWRKNISSNVEIKVEALDRVGLFAEILNNIASTGTNIEKGNVKVLGSDIAQSSFNVKVEDLDHLVKLVDRIKKIKDVRKVYIGKLK